MRLPRPYIPYSVRVIVAARQAIAAGVYPRDVSGDMPYSKQLRELLYCLFGDEQVHLDHDPALENREKIKRGGVIVGYRPAANDPNFLLYRTTTKHKIKTYVRGDGAQRSDVSQRRYLNAVAKNRSTDNKPKRKIAQRKDFTWPKRPMRPTGRSVK